jgi:hypothetical protein
MPKVIKSTIKEGHAVTLPLNDADLAALSILKAKTGGSFKLSISAASVEGGIVFITKGNRIYEFNKEDVFG